MTNFQSRLPRRRTIVQTISIVVIILAVAITALAFYVYSQAVGTFEVRRVSLPTRIFTDLLPLRPGQVMASGDLEEKLARLGYSSEQGLAQPGSFLPEADGIAIHLRPFRHPSGDYAAQTVTLKFKGGLLSSVTSRPGGQPVETAALEPELLTSVLSDQLENRRPVTLEQVPKHLIDAVIVTEDVRFWRHPGVDPLGILRALFRNAKARGVTEGGSTLTQQLVKNYYLSSEKTMKRKVVEAFMSVILDAKYSKREILEAYLNDIYLGRNRSISILGVGEAAHFYYGKPVSEINVAEAALLAGMIRGPNNYSPFTKPERALARRKTVLEALRRNRRIDEATYTAALNTPLPKKPTREKSGLSSIPFYVDRVLGELKRDYDIDDVKGRGLAIYTAIDLAWQDAAAKTVDSGLRNLEKSSSMLRRRGVPLEGVLIAVDVPSGEIRALIGGRNYERSQFNRALYAKRQVGSLFKPFVFLTAFEPSLSQQNITPATLVNDSKFVLERRFSKDWSPRNYNDRYYGVVTVRKALEESLNAASVRIGLSSGVEAVIKTANTLGIESEMESQPSIFLGSVGIPPIEMADAYSTIARMGSRMPLRTVRFVTDDRGRVIASGGDVKPVQVFPARDAFLAVHVMEGVVDRGTAASSRASGYRQPAAGKTGTTNEKRDAWFIGFTPQTLALTWIGFDDNAPVGVSGSEGAVPMWTRFMKSVAGSAPNLEFPVPGGIVFAAVDSFSGGLATLSCPKADVVNEAFKAGTEPGMPCPTHSPQIPPSLVIGDTGMPTDTAGLPGMQLPPLDPSPVAVMPPPADVGRAGTPPLSGGIFKPEVESLPKTYPDPPRTPPSQPPVVPPAPDQPAPVPTTPIEAPPPTST